jgi:hypothetical protein
VALYSSSRLYNYFCTKAAGDVQWFMDDSVGAHCRGFCETPGGGGGRRVSGDLELSRSIAGLRQVLSFSVSSGDWKPRLIQSRSGQPELFPSFKGTGQLIPDMTP